MGDNNGCYAQGIRRAKVIIEGPLLSRQKIIVLTIKPVETGFCISVY